MRCFFWPQMCKPGYHSRACSMQNAMKVIANRWLNYSGHAGAKTELRSPKPKNGSENRKPKLFAK